MEYVTLPRNPLTEPEGTAPRAYRRPSSRQARPRRANGSGFHISLMLCTLIAPVLSVFMTEDPLLRHISLMTLMFCLCVMATGYYVVHGIRVRYSNNVRVVDIVTEKES